MTYNTRLFILVLAAMLALLAWAALAQTTSIRDHMGREIGYTRNQDGSVVVYDRMGRPGRLHPAVLVKIDKG